MMNIKNRQTGFTLIELAIVLVIIGVLAGSFLATFGSRIDNTRRIETVEDMKLIKQAIYGYTITNNALPCPDCTDDVACGIAADEANDGREDRTGTVCSIGTDTGNIPWVDLGLGQSDAWGNRYRYWANAAFTDTAAANQFELTDLALAAQKIQTRNDDGTLLEDLATRNVAVILSHGKNGYGATNVSGAAQAVIPAANVDELENNDDDSDFVSRPPTDEDTATDGGPFDDLVVWISEFELKAKMVDAGVLPR